MDEAGWVEEMASAWESDAKKCKVSVFTTMKRVHAEKSVLRCKNMQCGRLYNSDACAYWHAKSSATKGVLPSSLR